MCTTLSPDGPPTGTMQSSAKRAQDYFFDVSHTLRVGPPSYMIVDGGATSVPTQTQLANANMTIAENQDRVCDFVGCDLMSLGFVSAIEYLHEDESFFASAASNWVSDYLTFLSPDNRCCRQNMRNGEFCSPTSVCRLTVKWWQRLSWFCRHAAQSRLSPLHIGLRTRHTWDEGDRRQPPPAASGFPALSTSLPQLALL